MRRTCAPTLAVRVHATSYCVMDIIKSRSSRTINRGNMPAQVVMGASLRCSFGSAQTTLVVLPVKRCRIEGHWAANIMDYIPMVNITSFGLCSSIANPQVAAATASAAGVLTSMPCIPVTIAPWMPGALKTNIANLPALGNTDTCSCVWGGLIRITNPGSRKTQIL